MRPPAVSVFLPTYCRGDSGLLARALRSVLAQEYRDFELLVADDGSTDSTARVLRSFAIEDPRVRVIRHERNCGLPALRIAELMQGATGRFFAFMFDDDVWYPHALGTLSAALDEQPRWDLTYGNVVFPTQGRDGAQTAVTLGAEPRHFDPHLLEQQNYIPNVAVLLRREILDRAGSYDPHILVRRLCDWDLWLRIASQGTIGHTDELIGEANGGTTTDSLGHTAAMDPQLTQLYMSLERDGLLRPDRVAAHPPDDLEIFGDLRSPQLERRAAVQFAAFFRQTGAEDRAREWEARAGSSATRAVKVATVAVLFEPDYTAAANLDACLKQTDRVIAVDNTPTPRPELVARLRESGVHYVPLGENTGIAAALNVGCRVALELGFVWALTLDQDSTPSPGMVDRLCTCIELQESIATATRRLRSKGRLAARLSPATIAVVAPVWQQVGGTPATTADGCAPLDLALTSGSLTRLPTLARLGWFREDFFIDRVDMEYSMRVQRHGSRMVQRQDALLLHRMGRLRRARLGPLSFFVTDYSPLRRYYMVRNVLELRRIYGHEFPAWTQAERWYWRREVFRIMLGEHDRVQKVCMMFQGWLDFRSRRFGRYELHHRIRPGI
jgi:GT2 family glycosyltransferase